MAAKKPAAARQCTDPKSDLFGATAVWSQRMGRWGVMNPGDTNPDALGGHWADEREVADWPPLQPKDATPA